MRGGSVTVTQFPQNIGLASTWDPELLRQVGDVIGYETRIYNVKTQGQRVGLAIRTPMVDLGREPRWGRNEESFGEDAHLDATLAGGLIKGLQGDNQRYIQVAATIKHFVVNNNEASRTSSDSIMDERDLREYYLVPFSKIGGKEEPWNGVKHKALARTVTWKSIVLLKNDKNLLPLNKQTTKSIAVIGMNGNEVFPDWYAGVPPYAVTPLEGIKASVGPKVRVRYLRESP